eukprot:g9641.t1
MTILAIIGAGPAGILLCAEAYLRLTENTSKSGRSLIYWYDKDDFQSGMLKQYDVPANTKLDYLDKRLKFFTESPIGPMAKLFPEIQRCIDVIRQNSFKSPEILEQVDPCRDGWPRIKDVHNFFLALSSALKSTEMIQFRPFEVNRCIMNSKSKKWALLYNKTPRVSDSDTNIDFPCFCCGGIPSRHLDKKIRHLTNNSVNVIKMEDALSFHKIKRTVKSTDKVAIIGNSHSSVLAIKNLIEASRVHRKNIMVYVLKPIQLAIWHDKGAYKWNSSGIKGLASAFVLEDLNLTDEDSIFNREMHVDTLWDTLTGKPQEFQHVIPLIGLRSNKLPRISIGGSESINGDEIKFDAQNAGLYYMGSHIGYEMGASRPEYYTDSLGSKYPVIAIQGGTETSREGWRNEHTVGWALFRRRAVQIITNILMQATKPKDNFRAAM